MLELPCDSRASRQWSLASTTQARHNMDIMHLRMIHRLNDLDDFVADMQSSLTPNKSSEAVPASPPGVAELHGAVNDAKEWIQVLS